MKEGGGEVDCGLKKARYECELLLGRCERRARMCEDARLFLGSLRFKSGCAART